MKNAHFIRITEDANILHHSGRGHSVSAFFRRFVYFFPPGFGRVSLKRGETAKTSGSAAQYSQRARMLESYMHSSAVSDHGKTLFQIAYFAAWGSTYMEAAWRELCVRSSVLVVFKFSA
jgi:hypothetical protein